MYSTLLIPAAVLLFVATHAFSLIAERKNRNHMKALRTMVWLTVICSAVALLSYGYEIVNAMQA